MTNRATPAVVGHGSFAHGLLQLANVVDTRTDHGLYGRGLLQLANQAAVTSGATTWAAVTSRATTVVDNVTGHGSYGRGLFGSLEICSLMHRSSLR